MADYGVVPEQIDGYLTQLMSVSDASVGELVGQLRELYSRRLWHELTLKLETFVLLPQFLQSGQGLMELYIHFIQDFEDRINQQSLVRLVLVVIRQCADAQEAVSFLNRIKSKVQRSTDAFVTVCAGIAEVYLQVQDLKSAKASLGEANDRLNSLDTIAEPHSAFYRVSSEYFKLLGSFADFYTNALKFLGCTDLATLSAEEKFSRAFDLGLAALLAPGIYNFGELLAHPVLDSLKETDKAWLIQVLYAFNSGNIDEFNSLQAQWQSEPDLAASAPFLYQKITLLALMEMVFRSPAKSRGLDFAAISTNAKIPLEQVEFLVMKALSLGLVKGTIDEVSQRANLTWVQPRVLDKSQLQEIQERFAAWSARIKSTAEHIEKFVPDLFHQSFLG